LWEAFSCLYCSVNTFMIRPLSTLAKTIALIQAGAPGGTGDMRVKAVIPFLRKYIPGNPNILVEYMPSGKT
jgi:hypothetical protein